MTCKLVNRKKLVNNYNLKKKIVFVILVLSPTTVEKFCCKVQNLWRHDKIKRKSKTTIISLFSVSHCMEHLKLQNKDQIKAPKL